MPFKFFTRKTKADEKPASPTTLGVGSVIHEQYQLEEEIGRGGMGIVYRGFDIRNEREVAIKVVNFEKANALTLQQFSQEAEITKRLQHPHIVAVYETGVINAEMPFIVMELVHGTSLDKLTNLTYARIIDLGKQICEALEYAHAQGLIYRDLKPGNVLIEKRGFHYFAKLTDFGLAHPRAMTDAFQENSAAGTLFYLAPELIAGQAPDIASDLYALGATLYEMITGRVPFSDFEEQAILLQHLNEPVPPPSQSRSDVPPELEAIVLKLLVKNPKERFASAKEVCEALKQIKMGNDRVLGNLPESSAEFPQYEHEIAQILQLLESNRRVTLLGNNVALAFVTGQQLADEFSDGIWWVDFESLHDPARVLESVVSTLNIAPNPQRSLTVALVEALREKNLLLILNQCEQVKYACVQLIETLLSSCSDVYVLAVSDQPLGIAGEKTYRV